MNCDIPIYYRVNHFGRNRVAMGNVNHKCKEPVVGWQKLLAEDQEVIICFCKICVIWKRFFELKNLVSVNAVSLCRD